MLKKVMFNKPKFKELNRDYTYVDMHHHSEYSDTFTKVKNIINYAKKQNIGVAITDHNEIKGSMMAAQDKDLFSIPGIEISSKEGPHVLIYFYDAKELEEYYHKHVINFKGPYAYASTEIPVADIVDSSNLFNTVTSIAHPFGPSYFNIKNLDDHKEGFLYLTKHTDAFEVLCGQNLRRWNLASLKLVNRMGNCYTAGSDGHVLSALGSVLTYSKADTKEEFLDNIRKRKNYVIGKEMALIKRVYPYARQFSKQLIHLKASIEGHVEHFKEQHRIKQKRRKE